MRRRSAAAAQPRSATTASAACASRSSGAAHSIILLFGRSGPRSLHGNSQIYQRRPKSCTATTSAAHRSPRGVIQRPAAPTTPTALSAARRATCRLTAPSPARRATHPACSTTTPATTTPRWARSSRPIRGCPTLDGQLITIASVMFEATHSGLRTPAGTLPSAREDPNQTQISGKGISIGTTVSIGRRDSPSTQPQVIGQIT